MPDVSISISARDRYSDALKTMQSSTRAFSKDAEGMQKKLAALDKTKAVLDADVRQAGARLKEAQENFDKTRDHVKKLQDEVDSFSGDEMGREFQELKGRLSDAESELTKSTEALNENSQAYGGARRNMQLVNREISNTQRGMQNLDEQGRRTGGLNNFASMLSDIGKAGALQMLGSTLSSGANAFIGSAFSSEAGTLVSSTLSGAMSGAALGSVVGPTGTAVGGLVGGALGTANGLISNFSSQDEAFKTYVQSQYDTVTSAQADSLANGSAIAAQRETDLISFSTMLGDGDAASGFLDEVKTMANTTPFLYDDLAGMSKTLMTFGYGLEDIIPTLTSVGDTGAALGMGVSDMNTVATAVGRMKSTDKASREYLDPLAERGIDVYGWLAEADGISKADVYDKVSRGDYSGTDVAQLITDKMDTLYGGAMEDQSRTYSGLTSTLQGLRDDQDAAMGEGYNSVRAKGIQEEIDFYEGENGEAMKEDNRMVGEWVATLENTKAELEMDAVDAVRSGIVSDNFRDESGELTEKGKRLEELAAERAELQARYEAGDKEAGAEMGRITAEAQVIANNEYLESEGYELQLAASLGLIEGIQRDSVDAYHNAGVVLAQATSKGIASTLEANPLTKLAVNGDVSGITDYLGSLPHFAFGLNRVPYDDYPALLHEGERVLTASQARERDAGAAGVIVTGNSFVVREEADIDRIAQAIMTEVRIAGMAGVF